MLGAFVGSVVTFGGFYLCRYLCKHFLSLHSCYRFKSAGRFDVEPMTIAGGTMPNAMTASVLFRVLAVAIVASALAPLLSTSPADAQSGGDYRRWLEWCRSIGGTPVGGASAPRCIPGSGGGQQQGPTPEEIQRNQAHAKHEAALRLWSSGDWDQVIRLLEEALVLVPDHTVYLDNLRKAREARETKRRHETFLRLFQNARDAYAARRWQDAIREYEAALNIYPNDNAANRNLQLAREQLANSNEESRKASAAPAAVREANMRLQQNLAVPVASNADEYSATRMIQGVEALSKILESKSVGALEWRERAQTVLEILAAHWVVSLPEIRSPLQREAFVRQAKNELQTLLKDALSSSTALMVSDLKRLEPFAWNPFGAEQRAEIARTESKIVEARELARRDIERGGLFRDVSTASHTVSG